MPIISTTWRRRAISSAKALAVGVGERAWFGTNAFSEQGDDLGIERVGLGEPSCGTGEIPDLAWVDDGERQTGVVDDGAPTPAAVLGGPVGFVGSAQSKQELINQPRGMSYLVVKGRRGGSAMAAAAVNAIATERE